MSCNYVCEGIINPTYSLGYILALLEGERQLLPGRGQSLARTLDEARLLLPGRGQAQPVP